MPLQPVDQLGAIMGPLVPFWDQREEFGDTNGLVILSFPKIPSAWGLAM